MHSVWRIREAVWANIDQQVTAVTFISFTACGGWRIGIDQGYGNQNTHLASSLVWGGAVLFTGGMTCLSVGELHSLFFELHALRLGEHGGGRPKA